MRNQFYEQVELLEAACHKMRERPEDPVTQEIVLRALAAIRPAPDDAPPLVVGLANVVWHYSEVLKFRLEQMKTGAADLPGLKRSAEEVCGHVAELKKALGPDKSVRQQ